MMILCLWDFWRFTGALDKGEKTATYYIARFLKTLVTLASFALIPILDSALAPSIGDHARWLVILSICVGIALIWTVTVFPVIDFILGRTHQKN
jgi:hypothetical protein